ncbi:MAG: tetratricopeptide repeat protein, partial [Bacteroidetes bacterium]
MGNEVLAIEHFTQAIAIRKSLLSPNHASLAPIHQQLGDVYAKKGFQHYSKAESHYLEALQIYQSQPNLSQDALAEINRKLGKLYYNWRKNNESIQFLENYYHICISFKADNPPEMLIDAICNLAYLYIDKGNFLKTQKILMQADSLWEQMVKLQLPQKNYRCRILFAWGDAYRFINDSQRALNTYRQAIFEWEKVKDQYADHIWKRNVGTLHQRIGSVYLRNDDFPAAIQEFKECINFYLQANTNNSKRDVATMYLNLADIYVTINEADSATHYLNLAQHTIFPELATIQRLVVHFWYINAQLRAKQFEISPEKNDALAKEADSYYSRTVNGYIEMFGLYHPLVSAAYLNYAQLKQAQGKLPLAFELAEKAIAAVYTPSNPTDEVPLQRVVLSHDRLLNALIFKCEMLYELYRLKPSVNMLKESLDTYKEADSLLNQISFSFALDGSKMALRSRMQQLYEGAIRNCIELSKFGERNKYLNEAFRFSEKNKALVLLSSMQDQQARLSAGLPLSVLEAERRLKDRLAEEQRQLVVKPENDSLAQLVISLKEDYIRFVEQLEKDYPEYFNLKYGLEVASISDVQQKLKQNECLLAYFYGEEAIYAFAIQADTLLYFTSKLNEAFKNHLKGLQQILTTQSFANNLAKAWRTYYQHSAFLYGQLFQAAEVMLDSGMNVVIIPDGELVYLPFEAFARTQHPTHQNVSISTGPDFLLYHYPMSYDYSATIHLRLSEQQSQQALEVLA